MTRTHRLAILISLLAASHASAAIVTYTDQATFLAALSSNFTTDFQSLTPGPLGTPSPFSGNGFSYQISSPPGLYVVDIGGDRSVATNGSGFALNFSNFSGGITALGGYFYFNTGSGIDATNAGVITAINGVDPNGTLNVTAPTSLTGFFGFISTGGVNLTSVNFAPSFGGFANVDDLIVGAATIQGGGGGGGGGGGQVPEPSTFAMLAAGLVLAGLSYRKR
jgi:hypothetical protein